MVKFLAAAAALTLALPVAALAQEVPSYASSSQYDQAIHGRVTAFDGGYALAVRDDNGYVDNVQLQDGTIINPTGLTLAPGMVVSILGTPAGPIFDANEIDTPYTFQNAEPYYAGRPWNDYGSSISLAFFFGNTSWWNGGNRYARYAGQRGNGDEWQRGNDRAAQTRTRYAPAQPQARYAPAQPQTRYAPAQPQTRYAPAQPQTRYAPAQPQPRYAPAQPQVPSGYAAPVRREPNAQPQQPAYRAEPPVRPQPVVERQAPAAVAGQSFSNVAPARVTLPAPRAATGGRGGRVR